MRIALCTAHYPPAAVPCGVGDYTQRLRMALAVQGHTTLVITSRRSQACEPATFPLADRWGWTDLRHIVRLLRAERPDVLLLQYTPEQYGYGFAFKLLPLLMRVHMPQARCITTFHTLVGGRRRAKLSAILLAAASHGVVSTHEELTTLFRRRLPWWAGKLREIPIGASIAPADLSRPEAVSRLRARLGLSPAIPLVACFGFASEGKGMDVLLRSAAVERRMPFHLVFVTQTREVDRPVRCALETLTRELGIAARVHWLDGLPDAEVARVLAGCDLYAIPYDDGVSLRRSTLMAGWQQGLAIVSTTPRFPSPLFTDGVTMLLVPPREPQALAEAITRVLQDPELRDHLETASQRIAACFRWESIAAAHLAFARELAAGALDG
jgi:glycosyltransferase involved in cell wall biosynthesis